MDAAGWLAGGDAGAMLDLVARDADERQMRLYACACCRAAWPFLTRPGSRQGVEVAERYARGRATRDELRAAARGALAALGVVRQDAARAMSPDGVFRIDTAEAAHQAADAPEAFHGGVGMWLHRPEIVRDLFGNPFRPARLYLAWLTPAVVGLARAADADPDADRMPILADALEEAGCDDAEVLGHCRAPAAHYAGCWVVGGLLREGRLY